MNSKLLFLTFFAFSISAFSQQITGRVLVDGSIPAVSAMVVNIRNNQKTITDTEGTFSINASVGDEIRIIKDGYDRKSITVTSTDVPVVVYLNASERQIEEVKVNPVKLTGDLNKDSKVLTSLKRGKLNNDLKSYNKIQSDPQVLARKGGDFVQPKGEGFALGEPDNKWKKIDFYNAITNELGESFFNELKIPKIEIEYFLRFALADFDDRNILKYGNYSSADFGKITFLLEQKALKYRNLTYKNQR